MPAIQSEQLREPLSHLLCAHEDMNAQLEFVDRHIQPQPCFQWSSPFLYLADFLPSLQLLVQYQLPKEQYPYILECITKNKPIDWEQKIHEFLLAYTFQESNEYSLRELTKKIKASAQEERIDDLSSYITLENRYNKIQIRK